MSPAATELAHTIKTQRPNTNAWFLVEKGSYSGWVYKHYMILYNPAKNSAVWYKSWADEYHMAQLGQAYTHPGL